MAHPYAHFIHHVQKPARYVGGEFNQTVKNWALTDSKVCLAFPDIYDIGMSHLGTKILYRLVNEMDGALAERAFAPWGDMEEELRSREVPLVSLENAKPLSEFDIVGFSLQFELTFTNVLNMMDLGGIPIRNEDRKEDDPLIIAGGPVATHPEPIAPFIDVFLVGDAEEKLPELVRRWHELRTNENLNRKEAIAELVKIGSLYAPSLYERVEDERSGLMVVAPPENDDIPYPVQRAIVEDLDRYPFPDDSPEPVAEAIFDRMSMEIARGCTEGCRFCQAGMIYRPVRERDPEVIANTLVSAIEKGGYDEASLTSLSTADYSCIAPLVKNVMGKLREKKVSLSVSSLRAYGLGDETLAELKTGRAGGLTFAPEAGTQRMRDVVNKNVSEEDIIESAHRIFSKGWNKMKMYFMIGLPTEEDEDVIGIVETGARVRNVGFNYHRKNNVHATVSVSSHVPKPHTPFQWCAMDSVDELKRKQEILAETARQRRIRVKWHDVSGSYIEGIFARGDIRVANTLEWAWKAGARFDGWDEYFSLDRWLDAMEQTGLEPGRYLTTLPTDGGLPWDHLCMQLEDGFLKREYRRSLRDKLSPPCGKPNKAKAHHTNLEDALAEEKKLICYNCGVACDMTAMRDDRIVTLRSLNALKPPPEPPTIPQLIELGRKTKSMGPQPPKRPEQGEGYPYRLTYTKLENVRLTSHLDMVRKLPRIFRRAGITMKTSQGYNPKPLMSFSSALPLGMWSMEEAVDVNTLEEYTREGLLEKLNAHTPDGLRFTSAQSLPAGSPKIARAIESSQYLVATPKGTDVATLEKLCLSHMSQEEWVITRVSRKSGREMQVNLLECVQGLKVVPPEDLSAQVPEYQDFESPVVQVTLKERSGAHVRADQVVGYLLDLENKKAPLAMRSELVWREPTSNEASLQETAAV